MYLAISLCYRTFNNLVPTVPGYPVPLSNWALENRPIILRFTLTYRVRELEIFCTGKPDTRETQENLVNLLVFVFKNIVLALHNLVLTIESLILPFKSLRLVFESHVLALVLAFLLTYLPCICLCSWA